MMSDVKRGPCQPNGPYCPGMDAMLDADVKRGIQVGTMMSLKTGRVTREVITHTALADGKKTRMLFTFCPCCAGRLIAEEKPADEQKEGRP